MTEQSLNMLHGGGWEPERGNFELSLLESAARSADGEGDNQENPNNRGIQLFLDITAATGSSPTLDIRLQARDPVSEEYFDLPGAAWSQKNTTGKSVLTFYPGIQETEGEAKSGVLPRNWRVAYAISDGAEFTFSIGGCLIH